jgi:hypothetical protein
MFETIDLSKVMGGAGSDAGVGGFWTGRTRDDDDRSALCGRGVGAGGFWSGRTRCDDEAGR